MAKESKSKAASSQLTEKETLTKELRSLIPKLDEEGLAFLVKQAHTHLYNMQVDALNQTIIKDEKRKTSIAGEKKKAAKEAGFTNIKQSSSGYHILFGTQWISFTNNEISLLIKIAKSKDPDLEVRGRLYNWLNHERRDVLITASIPNKFSDTLKSFRSLLKKSF